MDFNDIISRLKRLYNAVDKQYEYDIASNVKKIFERSGDKVKVGIVFGNHDEVELNNRIFGIINAIASLKDHLKKKFLELQKNPQDIESMINNSDGLKLIIDLWNQDKHGYPLTRNTRSNRNPKVINIGQGLTFTNSAQASVTFRVNADNDKIDKIQSTDNSVIKIHGDIVDDTGNLIMSLDKMIESSIEKIENLVNQHKLI